MKQLDDYRTLLTTLTSKQISSELWQPTRRSYAVKVHRRFNDGPLNSFLIYRSRRGWFLAAGGEFFQIPDGPAVVEVCTTLADSPASLDAVVASHGLESRPTWPRDEAFAQTELQRSVGWQELSDAESTLRVLDFDRRIHLGEGFSPPSPRKDWNFESFYDLDLYAFDDALSQLNLAGLSALRRCLLPGESFFALTWDHDCYALPANAGLDVGDTELWPVPVFPHGDIHIFVTADFRCGITSHPYGKITAFGESMPESLEHFLREATLPDDKYRSS